MAPVMNRLLLLACFAALALPALPRTVRAGQANYDALVAAHYTDRLDCINDKP